MRLGLAEVGGGSLIRRLQDGIGDIQSDQELAVAHAALRRDHRAGAGGEQDVRRSRLAALRDAIGVSGQDSAKEALF